MSYDLMVFNPEAAPKSRADFMNWYELQTKWTETHGYQEPNVTTENLRNWFLEMIQYFPAMNGSFAEDEVEDEDLLADYVIGTAMIYVGFTWGVAETAYTKMKELAEKHKIGFFDVSATDGSIFLPDDNGKLIPIDKPENLSSIEQIKNSASEQDKGKSVGEILFSRIFGKS